ncbi:hypothetical protein TSTA_048890 [Talaromyces stipitatus ATCC 10500]|uniref:Uncharacterized protein n=1 Tax=Talaromyces stipitatus (strain ATCC 10500 / CBS 375.48 / QM 6759 / NRRL 1006) TaxID=441959 RepID=B8ML33_TALSN|nr:uncharacterized protein TSTA_048890 [Talaromyces stipitatus ATCC 10500]EED15449.1 hypothetical protein TSTA_048890 [Talaromyces stipitatus ATCC 10500]
MYEIINDEAMENVVRDAFDQDYTDELDVERKLGQRHHGNPSSSSPCITPIYVIQRVIHRSFYESYTTVCESLSVLVAIIQKGVGGLQHRTGHDIGPPSTT